MGYTNYFTQTVANDDDDRRYLTFAIDATIIILTAETRGYNLKWSVDAERVQLNGDGEDGFCEDFTFYREPNLRLNFCKTERLPYDAVVTACPIALKRAYGESVEIGSDGDWDDEWVGGRHLYQMAIQETAIRPMPERKPVAV